MGRLMLVEATSADGGCCLGAFFNWDVVQTGLEGSNV